MTVPAANAPVRLTVRAASATYPIDIAPGLSERLPATLDALAFPRRRFLVAGSNVWRLHGERFPDLTSEEPILLPDGERFKHLGTVGRVYDARLFGGGQSHSITPSLIRRSPGDSRLCRVSNRI